MNRFTERSLHKRRSQEEQSGWGCELLSARVLLERKGRPTPGHGPRLLIIHYFSVVPLNSPSADGYYGQIIMFKWKSL